MNAPMTSSDTRRNARTVESSKRVRWQYIHSGAQQPHFVKVLSGLITQEQRQRIQAGLDRP